MSIGQRRRGAWGPAEVTGRREWGCCQTRLCLTILGILPLPWGPVLGPLIVLDSKNIAPGLLCYEMTRVAKAVQGPRWTPLLSGPTFSAGRFKPTAQCSIRMQREWLMVVDAVGQNGTGRGAIVLKRLGWGRGGKL